MKPIQSLEPLRKFLTSYLKSNPHAKLKTLYKQARTLDSMPYIGDWPLINGIVYECASRDKFFSARELVETYRLTTDPYLRNLRVDSKLVQILTNKDELRADISGL